MVIRVSEREIGRDRGRESDSEYQKTETAAATRNMRNFSIVKKIEQRNIF